MKIIINNSSMVPIYEQIGEQIKELIIKGELTNGDPLPSVRSLSKELKISALTVKKAYDKLEEDGLTATVHGKGSFVRNLNPSLIKEEEIKKVEETLDRAMKMAKAAGMTKEETTSMVEIYLEGNFE